jgi:hypothetical protein
MLANFSYNGNSFMIQGIDINNNKFIKPKDEKGNYIDTNNKTWQRIETSIHVAMRENRISEDRIKRIDKRVLELNQTEGEKLLLGEETKSEYKILEETDFQKMFELLAYKYCNSCTSKNNKCEVYPLMKKYGIPNVNEGFKCKYAYRRKLKMSCEKENE